MAEIQEIVAGAAIDGAAASEMRMDHVVAGAALDVVCSVACVDEVFAEAAIQVIIAEPIRNLANSQWPLMRWVARHLTDPGSGAQPHRFTEQTLDDFFAAYAEQLDRAFLIPGGREKVYVFNKR